MSNSDKHEEGNKEVFQTEKQVLTGPDAQQARNAGSQDLRAVEATRTNQSDGSLRKYAAIADQEHSIELCFGDKVASRTQAVSERELTAQQPKESLEQQSETLSELEQSARANPVLEPILALRLHAEKLKEGPEYERYKQLAKEQAAAVLGPRDSVEQDECGVHEPRMGLMEPLKAHIEFQENPWQAFVKLTPEQQRAVIGVFEKGSNIAQDSYETQIQLVAESVPKGFYHVGKGLLDTGVAAASYVINSLQHPEQLPKDAQQLAGKLAESIENGVEISQVVAVQAEQMDKTGDYSPVVKALTLVTETANECWQALPLEKQTEKGSELIANMGLVSVFGAADRLAKSGKLIDFLETMAKYAKDTAGAGRERAKQEIGSFLEDIFQSSGRTTNGFETKIPKQPKDLDDLVMLRNKGLPDGVSPSEQVVSRREYSAKGRAVHLLDIPEKVFEAAEKRGLNRELVQEKFNKVARALTESYYAMGDYTPGKHGSEMLYGTKLHELLRSKLAGDSMIHAEASYDKGSLANWGKLGTSRVDLALGEKERPFVSMCLKTLRAVPSAQQERGWFRNLPRLDDGSVIPRVYFKIGK